MRWAGRPASPEGSRRDDHGRDGGTSMGPGIGARENTARGHADPGARRVRATLEEDGRDARRHGLLDDDVGRDDGRGQRGARERRRRNAFMESLPWPGPASQDARGCAHPRREHSFHMIARLGRSPLVVHAPAWPRPHARAQKGEAERRPCDGAMRRRRRPPHRRVGQPVDAARRALGKGRPGEARGRAAPWAGRR